MAKREPKGTKALPPQERPRERCLRLGPEALSEAELLALLLGTGGAGEDVLDVARRAVTSFHSLERLAKASAREITALPGFGPARAATLKAAFELGRRLSANGGPAPGAKLDSSRAAIAWLEPWLKFRPQECFVVISLDNRRRVLRHDEVSRGILNSSLVHPREVFGPAMKEGAAAILIAHNHPSGDPEPSDEDLQVTLRLAEAGRLLGIPLEDHLILAREGSISLKKMGAIPP